MGLYQFEAVMSVSDIIEIEADSYADAYESALDEADAYYPVAPAGFSLSWDNIEITCIDEPDEDDE